MRKDEHESEVAQSFAPFSDPTDCSPPGFSIMAFSRPEYWSGLPFPSPGDLPDPGIEPRSPAFQADTLTSEPPGKPMVISETKETPVILCIKPVYNTVDSLVCPRFQAQTTGQTTLPSLPDNLGMGWAGLGCQQLNGTGPSKPLSSCHDQSRPPQIQYSEAGNSYL